jgi:hypothetical protein
MKHLPLYSFSRAETPSSTAFTPRDLVERYVQESRNRYARLGTDLWRIDPSREQRSALDWYLPVERLPAGQQLMKQ